jgi:membrane protein implicated in regulation of membrane protease activity
MKKLIITLMSTVILVMSAFAQIPQNVNPEAGKESESLWDSTSAIIFAAVIILLLIIGRTWSKKVHQKRDEMSKKDKDK